MIWQIRLVVLIPRELWNGQRDQKVWLRKESSVHTLCPFLATTLAGRLCVSWHWQVGITAPPPTGFSAISHMRSLWNGKLGHSSCFAHMCLFQSISHTQAQCRVSKVQQKTCLLGEQRARAPSVLILSWRIQGDPPRSKVVAEPWKAPGFLASGGEEFNPWPVTRLDHSELLYNKVLLKYKRDRASFWHRHQKGGRKSVPLLVFSWKLYSH